MIKKYEGLEQIGEYIKSLAEYGYKWVNEEHELIQGTFMPGDGLETLLVNYYDTDTEDILEEFPPVLFLYNESGIRVVVNIEVFYNLRHNENEFISYYDFIKTNRIGSNQN